VKGIVSGEMALPPRLPEGPYTLTIHSEPAAGLAPVSRTLEVLPNQQPAVALETPNQRYRGGETAKVNGQAFDAAGNPAANQTVPGIWNFQNTYEQQQQQPRNNDRRAATNNYGRNTANNGAQLQNPGLANITNSNSVVFQEKTDKDGRFQVAVPLPTNLDNER